MVLLFAFVTIVKLKMVIVGCVGEQVMMEMYFLYLPLRYILNISIKYACYWVCNGVLFYWLYLQRLSLLIVVKVPTLMENIYEFYYCDIQAYKCNTTFIFI